MRLPTAAIKMKKFIFDTNISDRMVDGEIKMEEINLKSEGKSFKYFATHLQMDEISKCKNVERRTKLIEIFNKIGQEEIPTESFVIGYSRLGMAKLGDGLILEELRQGNLKNTEDALIGEVAIKQKLALVSEDEKFRKRVIKKVGIAISINEFKILLK